MELFGLKNKDGEEFSLLISNGETGKYELKSVNRLVEPEPKFKVGDWVYYTNPPHMKGLDCVFRIEDIRGTSDRGRFRLSESSESWYKSDHCRLATPQEIESHLKKICDEKYIGKIARCTVCPSDTLEIKEFSEYRGGSPLWEGTDQMIYEATNGKLMSVYSDGKFAEILPQESKELPKTITELVQLLYDFRDADKQPKHTVRDFIIKQGYKVD
jgi:hypothetical protein